MRVAYKRWGEVTIKKQGEKKNRFDKTKSFSIVMTDQNYTIDQLEEILKMTVDLSEKIEFKGLKRKLDVMGNEYE